MATTTKARPQTNGSSGTAAATKKRLSELEARMDALSRSQAVIEFELDGTIIDANENFLSVVGYAHDEIVGKHHSMFVSADEARSEAYEDFWTALRAGEFQGGEFCRVAKDGSEVWIQATYNPLLDDKGQPYKIVKYASDCTERVQRAQQAAQLRSMVEQAPINMMMVDRDLTLTYMNKRSTETLRSLQHLLPVQVDDMIGHSIDAFHKNPAHQQALLGDAANLPHSAIISLGDEALDLLVSAIYDDDGAYVGSMANWEVTTEKLEQEREAARLRSMVEQAPINMMLVDLDRTLLYINKRSEETLKSIEHLLPMPVDDMIGQSIDAFHKNPAHQEAILSDASNLPHTAIIQLAEEELDLMVSPVFDNNGQYIAAMARSSPRNATRPTSPRSSPRSSKQPPTATSPRRSS